MTARPPVIDRESEALAAAAPRLDVDIGTIVAAADPVIGVRGKPGSTPGFTPGRGRRKIERGGMIVRIRLGSSLARLAPAPVVSLELPDGATVDDLYARLASRTPELAPALAAALPVMDGEHVERGHPLTGGQEVALLTPVAGG